MIRFWKRSDIIPQTPCLITNYNDSSFPLFNVELRSQLEKEIKRILLFLFPQDLSEIMVDYLNQDSVPKQLFRGLKNAKFKKTKNSKEFNSIFKS